MFTQTDPTPYGAGSAFESAYVYGGARPTVMTDPGGKRFGLGGESFANSGGSNPVQPQPWVATWSISPSGRDWGRFALRAFISTASSGGWIAGSAGDNRTFSSSATCADSRACIDVDFFAGRVRLEVNTSCNPGKTKCVKPDPGNRMTVSGSASSLRLNYHLVNPKAPLNSPAIDGEWKFEEAPYPANCIPQPCGTPVPGMRTSFSGDAYPSWEVYHFQQNPDGGAKTVMQLSEASPKAGIPAGLTPIYPNRSSSVLVPKRHP